MPTSSDIAIRLEGLSKAYKIHAPEGHITLTEQVLSRMWRPRRRHQHSTFWALKDINLDIYRGEVVGLIGRNGAGKSTLLKIVSRITPPTSGSATLYGRVGSLLEVGTGFHPELSGRENIYLNGSILGMRRAEISSQFADIVDFAGIGDFLDTPVKRYSSGMYVRLAFAVAAHLNSEILLVDEVLAVGDQEFQERCLGKMRDVTSSGRTVILVSHNLGSIHALAQRCVLLDGGSVLEAGRTADVLARYREIAPAHRSWTRLDSEDGRGQEPPAVLERIDLDSKAALACGEPLTLSAVVRVNSQTATRLSIGIVLSSHGVPVGASGQVIQLARRGRQIGTMHISIPTHNLAPDTYGIGLSVAALLGHEQPRADDVASDALAVEIIAGGRDEWHLQNWQPSWGSLWLEADVGYSEERRPQ